MPGPIKPNEIADAKKESFPEAVFDAFNELIIQHFARGTSTVNQDEVVGLMVEKGLSRDEISRKGWLDVEDAYRAVGWQVVYDKPGYDESYTPFFTFRKK